MGLIFTHLVPTNVATKSAMLMEKRQGLSGVEKFSPLQSSRVAAANKPTTAGRRPVKTSCTARVFMYFINILLMRIIKMNEGSTRAVVAVSDPNMARKPSKPALCTAV